MRMIRMSLQEPPLINRMSTFLAIRLDVREHVNSQCEHGRAANGSEREQEPALLVGRAADNGKRVHLGDKPRTSLIRVPARQWRKGGWRGIPLTVISPAEGSDR